MLIRSEILKEVILEIRPSGIPKRSELSNYDHESLLKLKNDQDLIISRFKEESIKYVHYLQIKIKKLQRKLEKQAQQEALQPKIYSFPIQKEEKWDLPQRISTKARIKPGQKEKYIKNIAETKLKYHTPQPQKKQIQKPDFNRLTSKIEVFETKLMSLESSFQSNSNSRFESVNLK